MYDPKLNIKIFNEAKKYLLTFPEINEKILNYYLFLWKHKKPLRSLNDVCYDMIYCAQNKRGMPNSIGDINKLNKALFNFNPFKISSTYKNWGELFDKVKSSCPPPGKMEKNNSKNYWVQFSKSIISISKFLKRFKSLVEFKNFVNQFIKATPDLRICLPLLLKEEIFGYQFALACDFVRMRLSPEFVKPDIHLKDIFIGIGISNPNSNDYDIFRDIIGFSNSIKVKPFSIDFVFWAIGSRYFYKTDKYPEIKIKNCSKEDFIGKIRTKYLHK